MKQLILILTIAACSFPGFGQDSLRVMSYDEFIQLVMENHPMVYRASIVQSMGESTVTESRGAFDPKVFGNINQKYYDGTQYYSHLNSGLKIPTWFGISAETGYQSSQGAYLNPEERVPDSGLWYAGIRLELGNGLIIDQRRAEFEKAKLYRSSSEIEKSILLNQLKRNASLAYWSWRQAYQELQVYQLAYDNASLRLNAVKDAALFGDRPYIDTVEATMSVQNRSLSLNNARTKFANAEAQLEMYLWADGFTPLELENTIPSSKKEDAGMATLIEIDTLVASHPFLQLYDLQYREKKIDLQLKREQLKPQLTLKYNAINEPINGDPLMDYSIANYTWGATFAYPLLTRKERGGVKLAKLKLEDQEMKNKLSVAELEYKISTSLNNYFLALEQFDTSQDLVRNNELMYSAEQDLFNLGESSIFMINSRESAWIKSRILQAQLENECYARKSELMFQLMITE